MISTSNFEIRLLTLAGQDKARANALFFHTLLNVLQPLCFDLGNSDARAVLAVGERVLGIEVRECTTKVLLKPVARAGAV